MKKMNISEEFDKLTTKVPSDFRNWDNGKVILYKLALARAVRLVQKYEGGRDVNEVMVELAIKHLSGFYD